MKSPRIAILLLAAGASVRMGQNKLMLPWKGTFLLDHSLQAALDSKAGHVFVILGANAEEILQNLPERSASDFFVHQQWQEGMGSSLTAGMEYIKGHPYNPDAILIMVADQPLMDITYLNSMIDTFLASPLPIVATRYGDRGGVPAIFDKTCFKKLRSLKGDSGARELLAERASDILLFDAGNRIKDIDTPEDYQKLKRQG